MKSGLNLTCILGFAIFITKISLVTAIERNSQQPISVYEVQEYAASIADRVNQVVESTLSIPPDQHTYENTLRPWNQLCMLLSKNIRTLNNIAESDFMYNTAAYQGLVDLDKFISEILNYHDLPQMLVACAQKILKSDTSTPLQRHVATVFINNNCQELLGLRPIVQEKSSPLFIKETHNLHKNASLEMINYHFTSVLDEFNILPIRSRRDRDDDKGGRSLEGGVTGKWGDGKGIQWEGYVKGEAHDGKGNYAEGKLTQKDDGSGEVDVRGGHETKK